VKCHRGNKRGELQLKTPPLRRITLTRAQGKKIRKTVKEQVGDYFKNHGEGNQGGEFRLPLKEENTNGAAVNSKLPL